MNKYAGAKLFPERGKEVMEKILNDAPAGSIPIDYGEFYNKMEQALDSKRVDIADINEDDYSRLYQEWLTKNADVSASVKSGYNFTKKKRKRSRGRRSRGRRSRGRRSRKRSRKRSRRRSR